MRLVALLALALVWPPPERAAQEVDPDAYLHGLQLLAGGSVEAALDAWHRGYDSLSSEGVHDPRIGVAYVREVAAHGLEGEHEVASVVYAWGFSGSDLASYEEVVSEEAGRIAPLMSSADSAHLMRLVEASDPEVLRAIRLFWLDKDPTPQTRENERLLEHWQRVVYAQQNFRRGRYTPYETDDRGTIHVKFGPPDKKTGGSLGAREDELRMWVPNALDRERLRRYDTNPQFEVWAYDRLNPSELVYFLFGNVGGTGPFQLVDGPHQLISDAAFSAASRRVTPGGIKAAYFLELFYYSDLAVMGGPFAQRLSELELLWGTAESRMRSAPFESTLEAFDIRYQQEDTYHRTDRPLHPDFSEFDDGTRAVALVVEPVRVLGELGEPQIYVVSLSSPKTRMESTSGRIRRRDIVLSDPDYRATHTLVVRDEELSEVGRLDQVVTAENGDMAVFVLRHVPERLHYSIIVDVERENVEARMETSQLPGRAHFEVAAPLPSDPERLVMSDLVSGVAPTVDEQYDHLPFPVIPSRTIWQDDPIRLYAELYHLSQDGEGVARYRYDFTIAALNDEGSLDSSVPPVTLSMPLEFRDATARDVFDIDIRALPLGPARVTVRASDVRTGRTVERTVDIEIVR